jgi:uncharacterized membrane protein YfcA
LAPNHLQGRIRARSELVLSLAMTVSSLGTASLLLLLGPQALYGAIAVVMAVLVLVALRTPWAADAPESRIDTGSVAHVR